MTSFFKGRTYLLILIVGLLLILLLLLIVYLLHKYAGRRKKTHDKSVLQSVDGSVIKYDTLRLVYNTTLEEQQNNFLTDNSQCAEYVPCDVTTTGPTHYDLDETDNILKTIDFVQPSTHGQRLGTSRLSTSSRTVSECSESYSELDNDEIPSTTTTTTTTATATNVIGGSGKRSRLRDVALGKISISLFFNRSSSTLRVNVIQWHNAGSVCLKHAVSPYIKITMSHEHTTTSDEKTFLTKTKGKENPVFDEEFSFNITDEEELEDIALLLCVCDFDKYSRQVVVGSVEVRVVDFMDVLGGGEGSGVLWMDLREHKEHADDGEKGEILYSLQYFPTPGRISFTLVKAKDLKVEEEETSIAIKVSLLFGRKIAKTHKFTHTTTTTTTTHGGEGMRNPEFNQSCSFDVPADMFEYTNMRLCVYAYSAMRKRLIGKTPSGLEETEAVDSVVAQWNEMVAQPRVPALYWHKLV